MKFAKIYDMEDGGQVLVKAYFDKGEGNIDLETILPNGVTAKVNNKVRYSPEETEEDLLNKVNEKYIIPIYNYLIYNYLCEIKDELRDKKELKIKIL